ncbi:PCYCGC domain-containing protein [Fredinandcohnia quinoae]|uniref:PCYCGC domain-containing protein n=1 Tax=Fredinandcohnia quinoae TaxID=2918902 RepID=A0AAW5E3P5_9BACI|nr:PCYCGC domain-containing protein [Fredinandcohnia sp. SECRCQ15]MCH1625429.1 PCYCGC domain-containing protein [Fredinandcohnia sp. SECRCQ15]
MKIKSVLLSLFLLSSMIISGCSSDTDSSHKDEQHDDQAAQLGDIREETESIEDLPAFLAKFPEEMSVIYTAAAENQELLESMPCYCGCGDSVGHKDNYDCFVFDNKKDGSLVWDDHGTKCNVCLEIAAKSIKEYQDGKSIKEIRTMIDEQYKEGYANPTPTPEV